MLRRSSSCLWHSRPSSFHFLPTTTAFAARNAFSSAAPGKIKGAPMVYISGEEMTNYTMNLILEKWIKPNVDVSEWQFFDLSCKSRDDTEDKVLSDAIEAGKATRSIFKEPTVTPTEVQKKKLGLKRAWGSPNGAMRRGWNGITISRDTIHIEGMELGFKKPVLFERHAIGGEYEAGWKIVGPGTIRTTFHPEGEDTESVVLERSLKDSGSAVVTYTNPLDNVTDLAHHFFQRCLNAHVTPYVVTKKTVFKWQEGFWIRMKNVFDASYKEKFIKAGLLEHCGGQLQHLISDAATMQIIRWTTGGFGMAAHNYDGDMLTDEISQVHRSPGFITSNLVGKREDGTLIKEFEASHGTVSDMWEAHLRGESTSLNPLGLIEALIGAMNYAAEVHDTNVEEMTDFTSSLRSTLHKLMTSGKGTRDLCGPAGLSTEEFVEQVGAKLKDPLFLMPTPIKVAEEFVPVVEKTKGDEVIDEAAIRSMFENLDTDGNGVIDFKEFKKGLRRLNVQPKKYGFGS